jgi:hypothetical protein
MRPCGSVTSILQAPSGREATTREELISLLPLSCVYTGCAWCRRFIRFAAKLARLPRGSYLADYSHVYFSSCK